MLERYRNNVFYQSLISFLVSDTKHHYRPGGGGGIMEDAKIMHIKAKDQDGYFASLHLLTLPAILKLVLTGTEVVHL